MIPDEAGRPHTIGGNDLFRFKIKIARHLAAQQKASLAHQPPKAVRLTFFVTHVREFMLRKRMIDEPQSSCHSVPPRWLEHIRDGRSYNKIVARIVESVVSKAKRASFAMACSITGFHQE